MKSPFLLALAFYLAGTIKLASSQTRFFCIHPSNTTYKETTIKNASKILDLNLDFSFLVHGYQSSFDASDKGSIPYKIGLAWVKENKTNFCGVDWRGLASGSYFTAALEHVQTVGKQLAQFIISLVKLSSKTMDSVRIAGHSLGAHVSGFAGQTIYEKSKTKISTIFALDAAAPTFTFKVLLVDKSNFTLSKENAKFVQCMQTTSSLGTDENLGHADFIANGGSVQRTCFEEVRERKTELIACSHSFAKDIFLASFTHSCTGYLSTSSDEKSVFSWFTEIFSKPRSNESDIYGIHSKQKHGVFELTTTDAKPYCDKK